MAFTEILPKELEEASGIVSFSLIKGSLFYPFNIPGAAVTNFTTWSTMIAAVTVLLTF